MNGWNPWSLGTQQTIGRPERNSAGKESDVSAGECNQCSARAVVYIKQSENPTGGLQLCMPHLGALMDRSREEILGSRVVIAALEKKLAVAAEVLAKIERDECECRQSRSGDNGTCPACWPDYAAGQALIRIGAGKE